MLAAGDAAPDLEETGVCLHRGGGGRMIRGDQRQRAVGEVAPEGIPLARRADGRRALGERADALDILLREDEVMWAGLAAHVHTIRLSLGDQRDPTPRADMYDVQAAARLPREEDGACDRLQLCDGRA